MFKENITTKSFIKRLKYPLKNSGFRALANIFYQMICMHLVYSRLSMYTEYRKTSEEIARENIFRCVPCKKLSPGHLLVCCQNPTCFWNRDVQIYCCLLPINF